MVGHSPLHSGAMSESVGGDESAPPHSDVNQGESFFHHACLLKQIYDAGTDEINTHTHSQKELGFGVVVLHQTSETGRGGGGWLGSSETVSNPPQPSSHPNSHLSRRCNIARNQKQNEVEMGSVQTVPGGDGGPGIPSKAVDYGGLSLV